MLSQGPSSFRRAAALPWHMGQVARGFRRSNAARHQNRIAAGKPTTGKEGDLHTRDASKCRDYTEGAATTAAARDNVRDPDLEGP
jgi:hypothetical protein